jgi:uncharacterized protein YbaP (TraB family)
MRYRLFACFILLLDPIVVLAQPAVETEPDLSASIATLPTVVVGSEQPGPKIWKVSKSGHTLWILGTLTPVPKELAWNSRNMEALVARSQEVLVEGKAVLSADIGLFKALTLAPTALKARKNPDGGMLKDVVSADLYAQWTTFKRKYIGNDEGIERLRPVFAAHALYAAAIGRSGLSSEVVASAVAKAAKKNKVKLTTASIVLEVEDPKRALKDFSASQLNDAGCLAETMARLESDLGTMESRANAWALGDLDTLRALAHSTQDTACASIFTHGPFSQKIGLQDLPARLESAWLAAAETALTNNQTTFATLPMHRVLEANGYLAALKARGYRVEEP